jgi:hypothetical protein
MKKLFIISLIIFSTINVHSQSATGQTNFASNVCCFNGFTWTINYDLIYNDNNAGGIDLEILSKFISVKNNKYQTDGKQFSPSDLGMSEWPVNSEEAMLSGTVTIYYKGSPIKTYNEAVITSKNLGRFDQWKDGGKDGPYAGIGSLKIKLTDFNLNDLSVKFTNVSAGGANPHGAELIYKAYRAKIDSNPNSTSENNNSLVINTSSNTTSQTSTSNTSTTTKPIDNYDPKTGLYTNPLTTGNSSSTSDYQKNYETGQQLGELTNAAINIFTLTPEDIARREAAQKAADEAYQRKKDNYYKELFRAEGVIRAENERIQSWETFRNVEYVAKIPKVMATNSQDWATFIEIKGQVKDSQIFGNTLTELAKNKAASKVFHITPKGWDITQRIGLSLIPILGQVGIPTWWDFSDRPERSLKKGHYYTIKTPECFQSFVALEVSNTVAKLNLKPILGSYKKVSADLIFDENKVLIGCSFRNPSYSDPTFQERTINKILADKSLSYLRPNASSFIFKDRIIIVNENHVIMYDLNAVKDRIFIQWPKEYLNIESYSHGEYKLESIGVNFKRKKIIYNDSISYYKTEMPTLSKELVNKLDIQIDTLATKRLNDVNLYSIKGVIVESVVKDSKAYKAKLEANDVILYVNDITVEAPYQLQWIVQTMSRNNSNFKITFLRNNTIITTYLE